MLLGWQSWGVEAETTILIDWLIFYIQDESADRIATFGTNLNKPPGSSEKGSGNWTFLSLQKAA